MYFIFEADYGVLRSEWQLLLLVDYPEDLLTPVEMYLAQPMPEPFRSMTYQFSVAPGMKRPFPDHWVAAGPLFVFSERLVTLLETHGVTFETFPATLCDRKTDERLTDAYRAVNLLDRAPCFDLKKSSVGMAIKRLVPSRELERSGLMLARDTHHQSLVVVHERLKAAIEAAGLTGCLFTPLDAYRR